MKYSGWRSYTGSRMRMHEFYNDVFFFTVIFVFAGSGTWQSANALNETAQPQLFSQKLVSQFGREGLLDAKQLGEIFDRLGIHGSWIGDSQVKKNNCSAESVIATHGVDKPAITAFQLQELCPSILYSATTGECASPKLLIELSTGSNDTDTSPTPAEVWGYGFLFVTIINMSALAGMWVVPIMNKRIYKMVLMYLICLAVGTLCGNAILSLIPEAHGMVIEEEGVIFVWKNLTVIGGIYLFFLIERLLKIFSKLRKRNGDSHGHTKASHTFQPTAMHDEEPLDNTGIKITAPHSALELKDSYHANKPATGNPSNSNEGMDGELQNVPLNTSDKTKITNCSNQVTNNGDHAHNHSHVSFEEGDSMIASVAYMIIFGDGLHNFIDGLAIGASFSYATYAGVSTSVAVICEEFPHELGDFAILLNSGMSVKQAVIANFASACTCYIGLVIGIILGELTEAGEWIFALAGGMFLYISLVDMLPEINNITNIGEEDGKPQSLRSILRIFIIQNAGLLSGFAIMLILALFAGKIQI